MPNYKEKFCALCGTPFTPTSPKQKYCIKCKDEGKRIKDRERDRRRSRAKNGYKEHTKICLACGKKFKTYYSKKKYCGAPECSRVRIKIKNRNIHLNRDKQYLIDKGRKYYAKHKLDICLKKAQEYRKTNPNAPEYSPGKTHKLTFDYVKEYVSTRGYTLLSDKYVNNRSKIVLKCPKGHIWETTFHMFYDTAGNKGCRCVYCYLNNNYTSKPEQAIRDYVESNLPDVNVIYNDRSVIAPKELDLYFPDHNLAVEVCGLYWHSNITNTPRDYHYTKMMECYKKNIRLITVFEDEVYNKFDLVTSRIKQALNKFDKKIYARKCDVYIINNRLANKFFEVNHIQGRANCKIAFGLFYEGELVSCCGLGDLTRKSNGLENTLELKRFCSKTDTLVVGGAHKLFKYIKIYSEENNYNYIEACCDMRFSNIFNTMYNKLGFDLLSLTKYSPQYFKNGLRCKDTVLKKAFKENLFEVPEEESTGSQRYGKIWDCGYRVYSMEV